MWLNKSVDTTKISSEDFEYLENRFGATRAGNIFSSSDLEDLEISADYPIVIIKNYKEDFEYDIIFAFKVNEDCYFYSDTFVRS